MIIDQLDYPRTWLSTSPAISAEEQTQHNLLYNIYTVLDQRRRRWANVVWILYKCFVFTGDINNVQ